MKKTINGVLMASALLAGLTGCTKDKNRAGADQGTPTALELVISFPGMSSTGETRATGDPNATDAEAALKTADVFIYTDGGSYYGTKSLTATDFTQGTGTGSADVYSSSTSIATTTGTKLVMVGVNLPSGMAATLVGQSLTQAKNTVRTLVKTDIDITKGLPMWSVSESSINVVDNPTNSPTVNKVNNTVRRVVAKVTVEQDPAMVQEGTAGKLGQLQWAVNNQNSKFFMAQGTSPSYVDPNWTAAQYNAGDFFAAVAADYQNVNSGPQTTAAYNNGYAVENTSDQKTMKELTRVTVRATFIPQMWVESYVANSNTTTQVTNPNYAANTPVDFWTVTPGVGQETQYFKNQTDASTYAGEKGVTADPHTGGMCYWNIFLNKAGKGDVLRNDYYQCNITRIVAPGQGADTLKDPNATPSTDSSITADVNILNWNAPIKDNYELVP